MRGPTKREKSSVLAYLKRINRTVNEEEMSRTLDIGRFTLETILAGFQTDGYARPVKSPLVFPKKATIAERIGTALSHSAQGKYYEITESGKR